MPIYEFCCKDCRKKFDMLIRGTEEVVCPRCGSSEALKLFSTFGVKSTDKPTGSGGSACSTCTASTCNGCK